MMASFVDRARHAEAALGELAPGLLGVFARIEGADQYVGRNAWHADVTVAGALAFPKLQRGRFVSSRPLPRSSMVCSVTGRRQTRVT